MQGDLESRESRTRAAQHREPCVADWNVKTVLDVGTTVTYVCRHGISTIG